MKMSENTEKRLEAIKADMLKEMRRLFGPYPPCLICGCESEFVILPSGWKSLDAPFLEDLKRIVTFNGAFPIGAWFCKKHSDKEIEMFAKKKGINLGLAVMEN
jgi:hypothetical protein